MSSPLSTSIIAFTRLTQKIKSLLDSGQDVTRARSERWMGLLQIHFESDDEVFAYAYAATSEPGKLSHWDRVWLELYAANKAHCFMAGTVLSDIIAQRREDINWRHAVWNDNDLRVGLMRANMLNRANFPELVQRQMMFKYDFIHARGKTPLSSEMCMPHFGPWALAMQWRDDIIDGRLVKKSDVLENTWWMYSLHSTKSDDVQKKQEIDQLLTLFPDSAAGALMFYVATQPEYQYMEHMKSIFMTTMPEKGTVLMFLGMSYLYEDYQEKPHNNHVWKQVEHAWSSPASMFGVFASLYPDMQSARQQLSVLASSYEQRTQLNTIELPSLGPG